MRSGFLKWTGIVVLASIAGFAALWAFEPWLGYSLLAAVLAKLLSGVAFVANIFVPAEERSFRIEALVTVGGSQHRAVGIATCSRRFETYGAERLSLGRRLRISDGHVSLTLPDGRQVQSSAFLVCSNGEFESVKDRTTFYLVDRRSAPISAHYTSVLRSASNPAAPFRVEIVSAGPTNESAKRGASYSPDDLFAVPPAIADARNALTSYVALPIPKEVWSTDEKLRDAYSAITEFRSVPKPPDEVLRRLVTQTNRWPASGMLAPDHSRVDLPPFGPPLPIAFVVIQTEPPKGYTGPPFQFPLPQMCLGQKCVPMPASPSERESIHARQGYLFDPSSQTLIAVRAVFAGIRDPGTAMFLP